MSITIRKHPKDNDIFFVNGKTVVMDQKSFISSVKLNEEEERVFKLYVECKKQ